MKSFITVVFLFILALLSCGFTAEARVEPRKILAGEAAAYSITCDAEGDLEFKLPEVKNIRWFRNRISTSRSFSSVNGRVSRNITRSVAFTVEQPGEYEIPPVEIRCGNARSITSAVKFSVLAPGNAPGESGNTPAAAEVVWRRSGKFYTGQWIPLDIVLIIPDGMQVARYSLPRLNGVENLIFHNFSANGRRDFGEIKQERTVYEGVNATKVIFPAIVRAIAAEKVNVSGSVTVGIIRRNGSGMRSGDDFFDSFFDRMNERVVPVNIRIKPAEKTPDILPLPDVEKGVYYFGTFGKLDISSSLSAEKCTAGEAVDLILKIDRKNTYMLKAPEIRINGFRSYPPETKQLDNSVEIRYCLIPLSAGKKEIAISFASFDPESGKYLLYPVSKVLEAAPSKSSVTLPSNDGKEEKSAENRKMKSDDPKPVIRNAPLYIKTGRMHRVDLVLWRNSIWCILTGFIFMPLAALLVYMAKKRRRSLSENPEQSRVRSEAKYAIAILKDKSKTVLSETEKEQIICSAAGAVHLERGAGAGEISSKIEDAELKEWFIKVEESAYNASGNNTAVLTPSIRSKLLKMIKRMLVLLFMISAVLNAGTADELFDAGKYNEAAAKYLEQLDKKAPSPELLYNLGTSYINAGKLPFARAALAAAGKLAPRDAEIAENLNLVNRKLLQEEVNRTGTPSELFKYCRDRLRPDEHLAMSALIFGIAMLLLAFNPSGWKVTLGLSGALFALFLLLMTSQLYDSYAPGKAVTLPEFLELKQLPSDGRNETVATIPGGSDARVLQMRGDWFEIESNGRTGWVKSDAVALITH